MPLYTKCTTRTGQRKYENYEWGSKQTKVICQINTIYTSSTQKRERERRLKNKPCGIHERRDGSPKTPSQSGALQALKLQRSSSLNYPRSFEYYSCTAFMFD